MNAPTLSHVLRFGVFELDTDSGELRRHGLKIRLPDQSFQILKELLSRPGEVVTREELRRVLWPMDTFVEFEVGLNSAVRKLREALDDSADNPRFVETVPRHGYRFIAPVAVPAGELVRVQVQPSLAAAPPVAPGPAAVVASSAEAVASQPRRWRLTDRRAAGVLIVLCAAILTAAGAAMNQRWGSRLRRDAAGEPIRAFLVLPFENLTGDVAQNYFVDSVTDALTVNLAQVDGLEVISRTTALQYRQTGKRLSEIGRELPVNGIVSGTVVRSGTGVRITAQLGRVATDRVEWGKAYEGELSHMLDLQQRIASDVAVAAGLAPPPSHSRRAAQTIAAEAYDAYLKGLTIRGQFAFSRAVAYFEQAIAIDPDFAEAHAALAVTQLQFLFGGRFSPHEAAPKAEAAARKALQLDDTLADAHLALGQILALYHWRWEESAKALQRAVELRNGGGDSAVGDSLVRQGRFDDAIAAAERGRKRDPLSVNAQVAVGTAYRGRGQHDRALAELRSALAMSPGNSRVRFQLGATFAAMGRMDDAIRELEIAARPAHGHNSRTEAYLGYAYAAAGRTADARAVLKELDAHRRDQYVSAYGIALIHDALGEKEPAVAALQRAYEDHAVEFSQIGQYPPFKAIATEPAFQKVMQQVGLPR